MSFSSILPFAISIRQRLTACDRQMLLQLLQTVPRKNNSSPLVEKIGTQRPIHRDRGLIPVQHSPPHEDAFLLLRQAGHLCKQCFPNSSSAKLRPNKKVLQIKSTATPG